MQKQDSSSSQKFRFARFLAELLDQRFTIPGTSIRIGLDPILGLIPGIGDGLANIAGATILLIAAQYRLPKIVILRMGINIALNAMIGAVPIFGDIFSIGFRSNVKNVQLLERYISADERASTFGNWIFVIAIVGGIILLLIGILLGTVWLIKRLWNVV